LKRLPDEGAKLKTRLSEVERELTRRRGEERIPEGRNSGDVEWDLITKRFAELFVQNSGEHEDPDVPRMRISNGGSVVQMAECGPSIPLPTENSSPVTTDVAQVITSSSIRRVDNLRKRSTEKIAKKKSPLHYNRSLTNQKAIDSTASPSSFVSKVKWDESLVDNPKYFGSIKILSLPESVVQSAKVYSQEKVYNHLISKKDFNNARIYCLIQIFIFLLLACSSHKLTVLEKIRHIVNF